MRGFGDWTLKGKEASIEYQANPERYRERNRRIAEKHAAGMTLAEIGRQENLCSERVRQIAAREHWRATRKANTASN